MSALTSRSFGFNRAEKETQRDELDRVAVTVNTTIGDVGRIIDQVKNATDAVAHDLRTPLTRVRSRLDDLRTRGDLPGALSETVPALIDDLDLVLVLERVAALLRISELEAREQRSGFQTILLAPLIQDAFSLPAVGRRCRRLGISNMEDLHIQADRSLLFEAISNLVNNAIKFARTEAAISSWMEGRHNHKSA